MKTTPFLPRGGGVCFVNSRSITFQSCITSYHRLQAWVKLRQFWTTIPHLVCCWYSKLSVGMPSLFLFFLLWLLLFLLAKTTTLFFPMLFLPWHWNTNGPLQLVEAPVGQLWILRSNNPVTNPQPPMSAQERLCSFNFLQFPPFKKLEHVPQRPRWESLVNRTLVSCLIPDLLKYICTEDPPTPCPLYSH